MNINEIQQFITGKLKRTLTEEEYYILRFAYGKGLDNGKQQVINRIVNFCEREEE